MRRSRTRTLGVIGASALVALVQLLGPKVVPLYDGVGFPDEPYRYVNQPNATKLTATAAQQTIPLYSAEDTVYTVASQERWPQVSLSFTTHALSAPNPSTEVTIKAQPQAPAANPSGRTIAGNVYHVTATSQPGPPQIKNSEVTISLRLPQANSSAPDPKIAYASTRGKWHELITYQVGADIYNAHFAGAGDYAMVIGGSGGTLAPSASPLSLALIAVGVVIAVVVMVVLAVRYGSSRKKRMPHDDHHHS